MNLVPANSITRQIRGHVKNLPHITSWLSTYVEDGEVLHLWQSDMSNAFYLFRLPPQWCPYLSFNIIRDGRDIGLSDDDSKYCLACTVLPMGWSSSVGVMQEVSERILLMHSLPREAQLVRHNTFAPVDGWNTGWGTWSESSMVARLFGQLCGGRSHRKRTTDTGGLAAWLGRDCLDEDRCYLFWKEKEESGDYSARAGGSHRRRTSNPWGISGKADEVSASYSVAAGAKQALEEAGSSRGRPMDTCVSVSTSCYGAAKRCMATRLFEGDFKRGGRSGKAWVLCLCVRITSSGYLPGGRNGGCDDGLRCFTLGRCHWTVSRVDSWRDRLFGSCNGQS